MRALQSSRGDKFWQGRRVLLTGHTGFKGSWLATWLDRVGAHVMGISLDGSPVSPRLWDRLDVALSRELDADLAVPGWEEAAAEFDPEVVLHLAAQALVPRGYEDPLLTFRSNVLGTARLMAALPRFPSLRSTVIVTTDKVYDPRQPAPHEEGAYLGGHDPYSASKAAAELVVSSWPGVLAVATARAGNVIGGGDRSPYRLLPDVTRSWTRGIPVTLRSPSAVRPWQHVLEPLHGYLRLAEAVASGAAPAALNLGPTPGQLVDVAQLVDHAADLSRDQGLPVPSPAWTSTPVPHMPENPMLEIDSTLARSTLGWSNVLTWQDSVAWTVEWEARVAAGESPDGVLVEQIDRYCALLADGTT